MSSTPSKRNIEIPAPSGSSSNSELRTVGLKLPYLKLIKESFIEINVYLNIEGKYILVNENSGSAIKLSLPDV